jgi:hypothetical protein
MPPCRTCGKPGIERFVEDVPDGVVETPSGVWKKYRPGAVYSLCEQHRHPPRPRNQIDGAGIADALSSLAKGNFVVREA